MTAVSVGAERSRWKPASSSVARPAARVLSIDSASDVLLRMSGESVWMGVGEPAQAARDRSQRILPVGATLERAAKLFPEQLPDAVVQAVLAVNMVVDRH